MIRVDAEPLPVPRNMQPILSLATRPVRNAMRRTQVSLEHV